MILITKRSGIYSDPKSLNYPDKQKTTFKGRFLLLPDFETVFTAF